MYDPRLANITLMLHTVSARSMLVGCTGHLQNIYLRVNDVVPYQSKSQANLFNPYCLQYRSRERDGHDSEVG